MTAVLVGLCWSAACVLIGYGWGGIARATEEWRWQKWADAYVAARLPVSPSSSDAVAEESAVRGA